MRKPYVEVSIRTQAPLYEHVQACRWLYRDDEEAIIAMIREYCIARMTAPHKSEAL